MKRINLAQEEREELLKEISFWKGQANALKWILLLMSETKDDKK